MAARAVAARTLNFLSRIIWDSFSSIWRSGRFIRLAMWAVSTREYGSMMRQMFSCRSMS